MSTRNPKSKGARTVTARKIEALAADIQIGVDGLRSAAKAYREMDGDHDNTALCCRSILLSNISVASPAASPNRSEFVDELRCRQQSV